MTNLDRDAHGLGQSEPDPGPFTGLGYVIGAYLIIGPYFDIFYLINKWV